MARSPKFRAAIAAITLGLSLTLGACVAEPGYYGGAAAPPQRARGSVQQEGRAVMPILG